MSATKTTKKPVVKKVSVTEANVRKAAARLLTGKLVSTEVSYVQRVLGTSATQDALDAKVLAVRSMPWSSIVIPD
jgi:hypothetical protein